MRKENSTPGRFFKGGKNNNVDILSKCLACNGNFTQNSPTVLEEQEQKTTFHVTCRKCGTSSIIWLSFSQGGVAGVGMATDLDEKEAVRVFGGEPLSADEIIDMHQLIKKHRGSISDLVRDIQ